MSLITLVVKGTRKLLAGNPHEQFDVAGAGNGLHGALRLPSTLPTAPTAILVLLIKEKGQADLIQGQRPVNDNYPSPQRSPAGSFATPSAAEIVVANRQK